MYLQVSKQLKIMGMILLASVVAGCSMSGKDWAESQLETGQEHLANQRYHKARVAFKNVLQEYPDHIEAHYYLGVAQQNLGKWGSAFAQFSRTLELDENHVRARLAIAEMYLNANHPERAEKEIDKILEKHGDNPEALILRSRSRARLQNWEGAQADAEAAYKLDAKSIEVLRLLARIHVHEQRPKQAIAMLRQAEQLYPNDLRVKLGLAKIYVDQIDHKNAESILEEVIEKAHDKVRFLIQAAKLYANLGRIDRGESIIKQAIALNTDENADLAMVDFLAQNKGIEQSKKALLKFIEQNPKNEKLLFVLAEMQKDDDLYQDAIATYQKIIKLDPELTSFGPEAKRKLATLYLAEGEVINAQKEVNALLKFDARDAEALLIRSNIYVAKNDIKSAISDVNSALVYQPGSLPALRTLARLYITQKNLKLAKEALEKAVGVDPRQTKSRLELAGLLAKMGEVDAASNQLDQILAQSPADIPAFRAKINLFVGAERWSEALASADLVEQRMPGSALGPYLRGVVFVAQDKHKPAREQFKRALQISPTAAEPLIALVKSYIAKNQSDQAQALLTDLVSNDPNNILARQLLAEELWRIKRYDEATRIYRGLMELKPDWPLPYLKLGEIMLAKNEPKAAIEVLSNGVKASPQDASLRLKLSQVYEAEGFYDRAIGQYERILANKKSSDIAANNLAMLLVTHKKDPESLDRALTIVKRFKVSNNPLFMDTLGWVHYHRGDYDEASSVLSDAVAKAPKLSVIQYHLGMTYYKKGYTKLAQKHLQNALSSGSDFPGKSEAKATLTKL